MQKPTVPPRAQIGPALMHHHLEEPIPGLAPREIIKTICLGLGITLCQYAVLIYLIGLAVRH